MFRHHGTQPMQAFLPLAGVIQCLVVTAGIQARPVEDGGAGVSTVEQAVQKVPMIWPSGQRAPFCDLADPEL
ncbi:MAG: hypothetical protein LAT63_10005 [Marinobacter sp.]|nr:hypothetical protein [Marinobacter sp.]